MTWNDWCLVTTLYNVWQGRHVQLHNQLDKTPYSLNVHLHTRAYARTRYSLQEEIQFEYLQWKPCFPVLWLHTGLGSLGLMLAELSEKKRKVQILATYTATDPPLWLSFISHTLNHFYETEAPLNPSFIYATKMCGSHFKVFQKIMWKFINHEMEK